jgi:LytS/YehU family sensor histidine kinase
MLAAKFQRETGLLFTLLIGIFTYWVSVQTLIALHRQIYLSTTGMTERFRSIFDSLSYQVFDSYLVIAVGIVVLVAHRLYVQWKEQKKLAEVLKQERTQAELNFLKAQINPHFIFNTLNNVQFLIDESNHKARKLVQDFGDLLRYQLYETGNAEVSVNREIEYLKQYIEIQKVRKEEGFEVNTRFGDFKTTEIAPLLLIIPLENAFKYSPNSVHGYIRIDLDLKDDKIVYRVENPVSDKSHSELTKGGLGIDNLKKRLDLIYGDRASFHLDITDNKAIALLTIKTEKDEA